MRVALVNPPWSFDGSIYFGCREPHLPLELGYAEALLEAAGMRCCCWMAHLCGHADGAIADAGRRRSAPDMTVVTTAPSYLFWRCAPPELRVPQAFLAALGRRGGRTVAVGPHGSVTPRAALRKLGVDVVVRGECEEVVAGWPMARTWPRVPSIAFRDGGDPRHRRAACRRASSIFRRCTGRTPGSRRHRHHHHRFEAQPHGAGRRGRGLARLPL